jgi:hypothetical protein
MEVPQVQSILFHLSLILGTKLSRSDLGFDHNDERWRQNDYINAFS